MRPLWNWIRLKLGLDRRYAIAYVFTYACGRYMNSKHCSSGSGQAEIVIKGSSIRPETVMAITASLAERARVQDGIPVRSLQIVDIVRI